MSLNQNIKEICSTTVKIMSMTGREEKEESVILTQTQQFVYKKGKKFFIDKDNLFSVVNLTLFRKMFPSFEIIQLMIRIQ